MTPDNVGPGSMPPPPPPAPPAPHGSGPGGGTVSPNRSIMIVLSYLGLLALIPLLVEKEDREVQWHAKHGLVLAVAWIIVFVALQVVVMILGAISGGLGCLFGLITPIVALAILVLHVFLIVKGINGERFRLPVLSDFADRF